MTQPQGQGWCPQLIQHPHHKSKSRINRNTRKCRLVLPLKPSLAQLLLGWVKWKNSLWFRANPAHTKGYSLAGSSGGRAEFQIVEIRPAPSWVNSVSVLSPEKFWFYKESERERERGLCALNIQLFLISIPIDCSGNLSLGCFNSTL